MSDNIVVLLGRLLIAVIFIFSGVGKLMDIAGTAGYFGSLGLPVPLLSAWLVGLFELLAGLAILIGWRTGAAALLLAAFTLASAFIAHLDFSNQMELISFLKNLAIAGGLLVLASNGAGALSLDAKR